MGCDYDFGLCARLTFPASGLISLKRVTKRKQGFSKNRNDSGEGMVCPRRMSFSQFVVHMSTTNCEKDSLLGQTIPSPEPFLFFENPCFFLVTLYMRPKKGYFIGILNNF